MLEDLDSATRVGGIDRFQVLFVVGQRPIALQEAAQLPALGHCKVPTASELVVTERWLIAPLQDSGNVANSISDGGDVF